MNRLTRAIAIGCLPMTFLTLAACGGGSSSSSSGGDSGSGAGPTPNPATGPCHTLSTSTCAVPFPSNEFSLEDPESATGLRLKLENTQVDGNLLAQLPDSISLPSIFNTSDGFSAASPVVFEFLEELDKTSLALDGGETVVAINLATGERHALTAAVSEFAQSDKVSSPSQVIEIFPRARWSFGATYAVVVTDNLKATGGENLAQAAQLNLKAVEYAQQQGVLDEINEAGINNEQLLSLTVFTIRSEANATSSLRNAAAWNYEQPHEIRNLKAQYFSADSDSPIAAFVLGELKSYDFRDPVTREINDDPANARETWLEFRLTLPKAANTAKVPVAIYGHGLSAFKESDIAVVAVDNAEQGIATISIDHPNHGSRKDADGGYVMKLVQPTDLHSPVSMFYQSSIDFGSLLETLMTSLKAADVLPKPEGAYNFPISTKIDMTNWELAADAQERTQGDGIAEIDTDKVFYQGTSLGGVLGSSFLALAPYEIKGAALQVAGVGVMHILSESVLWDRWFYQLIPEGANGAQAVLLRSAATHMMDYGDAINFVHYFHTPPAGITPKRIALITTKGDLVVPNSATVALAEIAQLPLASEELFPVYGAPMVDDWVDGSGIKQVEPAGSLGIKELDALIAHVSFITPTAKQYMSEWIDTYVLELDPEATEEQTSTEEELEETPQAAGETP